MIWWGGFTSGLRYLLGGNDKFGEVGSLICENLRHLLWNILKTGSIRHRETEYHAVCVLLQCLQYEYRSTVYEITRSTKNNRSCKKAYIDQ